MVVNISRRTLLALAAGSALPLAMAKKKIPIGLELYSVRNDLKKDLPGTLRGVAKAGYECVEFYAPYFAWTTDYTRDVRKQLDDLGMKCFSTHNGPPSFTGDGTAKAIELNQILGSRYIIMASAGKVTTIDDWKRVAETLNTGNEKMKPAGIHSGYHNHAIEWIPLDGQKPLEVLAANTDKTVVMQFDVGTCLETGNDPVAWIHKNPGRIKSLHLKDWNKEKGYRVLFGDGSPAAEWKKIFEAAEKHGGVEYYLIEQEGSDLSEMETAERCITAYRKLHM
jgi:sugar phosphate isomerase/epimerase